MDEEGYVRFLESQGLSANGINTRKSKANDVMSIIGKDLDVIVADDEEMYKVFKNTVQELKKYKDMYEKNFGPLCVTDTLYYDSYKWLKNPWPWMNEGGSK